MRNDIPQARSGLAAVLFADIADYARLVSEDESHALDLSDQCLDAIKRRAAEQEGALIRTTGDGCLLAFQSAIAAVRCAVAAQADIIALNADSSDERQVRVRIGIHLGEITPRGGDIYGQSVNIAARLEALADPGTIVISDIVYQQVKAHVAAGYECLGARQLKNIFEDVIVYRVHPQTGSAVNAPSVRRTEAPLAPPDRPSIVILPFRCLSTNPDHLTITDGITEEVIGGLARFTEIFVISRQTSFALRNLNISIKDVGAKLGVEHVAEGAVRFGNDSIRVSAQLIEAASDRHFWSETFAGQSSDIFAVLDELAKQIAARLAKTLEYSHSDRASLLHRPDLKAYSQFLIGQRRLERMSSADNAAARSHFESALRTEPSFARACAAIARTHHFDWQFGWGNDPAGGLDRSVLWARKAISLDRQSPYGYAELGFALMLKKSHESAIENMRQALKLNPHDPDLMVMLADVLIFDKHIDEGRRLIEDAMRLNPYYPDTYLWYLADAYFSLRDYKSVIKSVNKMNNPISGSRLMAASFAYLGDRDSARQWSASVLEG